MRTKLAFCGFVSVLGMAVLTPVAAQDVENGAEVFKKCRACHQVGENAKNAVGPSLNGLFGRKAGTIEGFNYSEANKTSGVTWDDATFATYIKDPLVTVIVGGFQGVYGTQVRVVRTATGDLFTRSAP